jgi:hypothetical protein
MFRQIARLSAKGLDRVDYVTIFSGDSLVLFGLRRRLRCHGLAPIPGLRDDGSSRPRRRRFELGEDRFQRIEPRGEREALVIELLAQIFCERGGLFVSQVEGHPGEMERLTVPWKAHPVPGFADIGRIFSAVFSEWYL